MENKIKKLGKCPICGKGEIVEGTNRYACVYSPKTKEEILNPNAERKVCTFSFYKEYFQHELTDEDIAKLLAGEETKEYELTTQDGKKFTAKLKLDKITQHITPIRNEKDNVILNEKCPICGGDIVVTHKFYACKNALNENKSCYFFVNKVIAGVEIDEQTVEELIKNKTTDFIDGFENNQGKEFCAKLTLAFDEAKRQTNVKFDNSLCKCPKCGGTILVGHKAYGCSNYKEKGCNFTIWREMNGRTITPKEAKELCETGSTDILKGFQTKGKKKYDGKLIFEGDYKVKII